MDNERGQFKRVDPVDLSEETTRNVERLREQTKNCFRVKEIVKIKESYFTIRNIDNFSGIMTLKLLPRNDETARKYELQEELNGK